MQIFWKVLRFKDLNIEVRLWTEVGRVIANSLALPFPSLPSISLSPPSLPFPCSELPHPWSFYPQTIYPHLLYPPPRMPRTPVSPLREKFPPSRENKIVNRYRMVAAARLWNRGRAGHGQVEEDRWSVKTRRCRLTQEAWWHLYTGYKRIHPTLGEQQLSWFEGGLGWTRNRTSIREERLWMANDGKA